MQRPSYYWSHGDAALYFLGNPAVWWGTALVFTFSFLEAPGYRERVFGLFPGWR